MLSKHTTISGITTIIIIPTPLIKINGMISSHLATKMVTHVTATTETNKISTHLTTNVLTLQNHMILPMLTTAK